MHRLDFLLVTCNRPPALGVVHDHQKRGCIDSLTRRIVRAVCNSGGIMRRGLVICALLMAMPMLCIASQRCEGLLKLSREVRADSSNASEVFAQASNFCSEYSKMSGSRNEQSFGASYKFLAASYGASGASIESVAARYCSAVSISSAKASAYELYVDSIAPGAFAAYTRCVDASEEIVAEADPAAVLPEQFDLAINFRPKSVDTPPAEMVYSGTPGISCGWKGSSSATQKIKPAGTALLTCKRADTTKPGYVKVVRTNGSGGETVPWGSFDKDGNPVNLMKDLMAKVADLERGLIAASTKAEESLTLGRITKAMYTAQPWSEVRKFHKDCADENVAIEGKLFCSAAAQGYCQSIGYVGGYPTQVSSAALGFVCTR
jgi:hypothetical protein